MLLQRLIESYKRFGQDGLSVNYRIDGIPVAFGAASTYDAFGIPIIKESVLENIGDVDRLDLEKLRFENDHNAQVAFDAVRYIQDELNDEIFTGVGLMGPFTTCRHRKNLKSYAQRQRESS